MSDQKQKGYINKSKTDSWATPEHIKKGLNLEFAFDDFDPCPLNDNPEFNGLNIEWANCSFVNPPYSRLKTTKKSGIGWIEKAHIECQKNKTAVLLIPARTDTTWFHDIIIKYDYEVRFIKGRLTFPPAPNSAPFPSMLVIFKMK
jgi:site-specific DNA-methyltransferase (adenine-specific)